jgi:hypothetical protein
MRQLSRREADDDEPRVCSVVDQAHDQDSEEGPYRELDCRPDDPQSGMHTLPAAQKLRPSGNQKRIAAGRHPTPS